MVDEPTSTKPPLGEATAKIREKNGNEQYGKEHMQALGTQKQILARSLDQHVLTNDLLGDIKKQFSSLIQFIIDQSDKDRVALNLLRAQQAETDSVDAGKGAGAGKAGAKKAGDLGKAGAGIGGLLGGIVGGLGAGIGAGLRGLATGLAAFGLGSAKIIVGAGALATVIGIFAGTGVVVAKAFKAMAPDIRDGLIDFSDDRIDGDAVAKNAKGLAMMGLALGAKGVGTALSSLGNIAKNAFDGLNAFFGGEKNLPLEDLREFGKEDLDPNGFAVKNAKALAAFGGGLAAMGSGELLKGLGNLAGTLLNGIAGFFGGEPIPKKAIKEFGGTDIAATAPFMESNLEVIETFYAAMRSISGEKALTGLAGIGSGIIDGLSGFFGGKDIPYDKIKEFGSADLAQYKAGIEGNLPTVLAFYDAMKDINVSKSKDGLKTIGGAFVGAITGLLGQDKIPFEAIKNFSKEKLGSHENAEHNVKVAAIFGKGMAELVGVQLPSKGMFTALGQSISGFFGTTTMEDLKKFSEMELNSQNAKLNAETISEVAKAMGDLQQFTFTDSSKQFLKAISDKKFTNSMHVLSKLNSDDIDGVFRALTGMGEIEFAKNIQQLDLEKLSPQLQKLGKALEDMGGEIDDGEAKAIRDAGAGLESIVSSLNKLTVPIVGTRITADAIKVNEGSKDVGAGGGQQIIINKKEGDIVGGINHNNLGISKGSGSGTGSKPDGTYSKSEFEAGGFAGG